MFSGYVILEVLWSLNVLVDECAGLMDKLSRSCGQICLKAFCYMIFWWSAWFVFLILQLNGFVSYIRKIFGCKGCIAMCEVVEASSQVYRWILLNCYEYILIWRLGDVNMVRTKQRCRLICMDFCFSNWKMCSFSTKNLIIFRMHLGFKWRWNFFEWVSFDIIARIPSAHFDMSNIE